VLVDHVYRDGLNTWTIAYDQTPSDGCEGHLGDSQP